MGEIMAENNVLKEVVVDDTEKDLTPKEYFDMLKAKKHTCDDKLLSKVYTNCMVLIEKYKVTKQLRALAKLIYHVEKIESERELVKMGIDTFVYSTDVKKYVKLVKDKSVKCIELNRYEREIPDDIVTIIKNTEHIFTGFLVVFTDYTDEYVEKTKQEKDPILFGYFKDYSDSKRF